MRRAVSESRYCRRVTNDFELQVAGMLDERGAFLLSHGAETSRIGRCSALSIWSGAGLVSAAKITNLVSGLAQVNPKKFNAQMHVLEEAV